MSDGAASIYVALIVQVGAVVLWLAQRKRGRADDDSAWQRQSAQLAAQMAQLWGERISDLQRELAGRDQIIAGKDSLIQQLLSRGSDDRD